MNLEQKDNEDVDQQHRLMKRSKFIEQSIEVGTPVTTTTTSEEIIKEISMIQLPEDLRAVIPEAFVISQILTCEHDYDDSQKKLKSDEDVPCYTFTVLYKAPSRSIEYRAKAFKFDTEHEELKNMKEFVDWTDLKNQWIVVPVHDTTNSNQSECKPGCEGHFYRMLVHFSQHWNKWLEDENMKENEGAKEHVEDFNIVEQSEPCVAKFKRMVWPNDCAFVGHLNAVSSQHYNNPQRRRSLVLSSMDSPDFQVVSHVRSKMRQKRRRSIVQEDTLLSPLDEVEWSRYIVVEFRSDSVGENMFSVHDMNTNTTKSKIHRSLPENALVKDASCISSQSESQSNHVFTSSQSF